MAARSRTHQFPEYSPARILDALDVPPFESSMAPGAEAAQVLFMPSFHPECVVTVSLDDEQPTVTLVTAQTNLWYWWCHQLEGAPDPEGDEPALPAPERWEERAAIPASHVEHVRSRLLAVDLLSATISEVVGFDGVQMHCGYRNREGLTTTFSYRQGGGDERAVAFVQMLYELATRLLSEERTVRVLESLYGYLDLGLPVKLLIGSPFTVRVFGGLTSGDEAELRAAVGQVPVDTPLLMDFSNFDAMGTRLFPVFRELLRRPGPTAWWANWQARPQLEELGVPRASIFGKRAEAIAALSGST